MVEIVGHATAGGWQDSTTIIVPEGVQEGDLLRVWISANDTPQVQAPTGWDVEVSDVAENLGGNTAVYSFIRTATAADAVGPSYTWTWTGGSHWRFAVMVALSGADGVRDYVLNTDPDTSTLDSAALVAEQDDLLLVCGFNRHETDKTWSPAGLTEIANLDRGVVAAHEAAEQGRVQTYSLNAGQPGSMAVLTALIASTADEEEEPSSFTWQNSFDGPHQTFISAENSSAYGDPVSYVANVATYSTAQSVRGTASLWGGSATSPGVAGAGPLNIPEDGPFALRFYFRAPHQGNLVVSTEPSGTGGERFLLVYAGMTDPRTVIGRFSDSLMNNSWFTNRWIRFEMVRNEDGRCTARLWNGSNVEASGEGSENLEVEWDDPGTAFDNLYFRLRDNVYHPGTELSWGTYVDEVKIVPGSSGWIGPADFPPPEILWQNSFDGPGGVSVTPANSAQYGDPVGFVGLNVRYTRTWSALGAGSVRLGGSSAIGSFETSIMDPVDWSIRVYIRIPEGATDSEASVRTWAHTTTSRSTLFRLRRSGTLEILGQTIEGVAEHLYGSVLRLEASKIGQGCTVRLWWNRPHSIGEADYEVTYADTTWQGIDAVELSGSYASPGIYFDELVVADGAWIGPVDVNEVFIDTAFSPLVRGVVGGSANAVADIAVTTQVQGYRSDTGVAIENLQFDTQGSGEGFIPTVAAAEVLLDVEADGGAYYTGEGSYDLDISLDSEAVKTTAGDALEGELVYDTTAQGRARTHLPDVPLVGMQYRLIAYDPDGERRGQLPWPLSFQLGVPLNDIPSLALEYLKDAPGAGLLNGLCEVAVEFAAAGSPAFTEPPGCRFLNLRHQEDPADRAGVVRYTMPSYAWMLRKVRNLNTNALNEEGQREFARATAGRIIHTFLTEAQSRGNVPGLVWDFTATHDSAGAPWATAYNISFDAGQDLWTILEALATQHALDWRVHRRTLQMYNPDTAMNRDRSEQAVLRLHRDVTEAPNDRSGEELASRIFVQGDNAHVQITHNNPVMSPWGAWEDYISQNGVSDTGTLTALAQWRLEATRGLRTQMTRGIVFNTTRHLPFLAYQVGDYVSAPGWFSQMDPLRVRQITISSTDPHSLEGNLVLNDRFIERQLRNDRKINALTGGSPPGGGGGGGRPPGEDTRTPQAPQNLLLHSDAYINAYGEPRAQITADWSEVTRATNNTEMEIRRYEVWVRRAAFNASFQFQTEVDHPQTTAFMSWFEPGQVYQVRVRAFGRNDRPGLWSAVVAVTAEKDTEPPSAPSGPDVSSRLGVLRVNWDGLDFQGMAMPSDFDHLQVWMGSTPNGEFDHVDTLYRAGVSVIPDQPYGQERFFFFTAVDRAGNESDPSAISSGTTQRLVPIDVTPGSIGYELLEEGAVRDEVLADEAVMNRHVAAGQITGEKIRAYSVFADRLAVGTSRNLITDPKHESEELNQTRLELASGPWSYVWDEQLQQQCAVLTCEGPNTSATYYYAQSSDADSFNDPRIGFTVSSELGRVVTRGQCRVQGLTTGQITLGFAVRSFDSDGVQVAWVYSASQTVLDSDGDYEIVSDNGSFIRPDASYAVVAAYAVVTGANEGAQLRIGQFFGALSNGQVLIENGAVSANKIAANAVTADKVEAGAIRAQHIRADAIDADKIAARAITAKHTIIGASIRTTAQTNRGVVLNSNGFTAYDSVGRQTLTITSSTGAVNMLGQLRTGRTGQNRVELSDSANYFGQPGLRMYSGGAGARDASFFIADPQGSGNWSPYATVLAGSEVTRNSSGRTDFVVRHGNGGGADLGYAWSTTYGYIGLRFSAWNFFIQGRLTLGQSARDMFAWTQSSVTTSTNTYVSWTFTYGSAAANGGRLVSLTGHSNGTSNRTVDASVSVQNLGNFFATSRSETSHRLQYVATWVQNNV